MKKKWLKKLMALSLALSMAAGTLTACGSSESGSTDTGSDSTDTAATSEASESTEETTEEAEGITFPLEETVTLTVWIGALNENLTNLVSDYNETEFFKELEARTNVHIEFETISSAASATEAYNLMLTSGTLPDIIYGSSLYSDGLDAAVDDGYYVDLTPYLETYMPNFNALRLADEEVKLDSETDEGRVVGVRTIFQEKEPLFMGIMIRKDWLDADGLEVPETIEEWETVLTSFKENHGATAALALNPYYDMFLYGFNASTTFQVEDGTVVYGPITDNMKEALTVYADWYKKGLIDSDFMSREASYAADFTMIVTGQTGAFNSYYTLADYYYAYSSDPDMELVAVTTPPISSSGEESKLATPIPVYSGSSLSISTDCENPEIAMAWIDYLFSEEGALLANYGTEGVSFEYNEDGEPEFTDLIVNNPDGLSMNQAMCLYTCPPQCLSKSYDYTREMVGVSDDAMAMLDVWDSVSTEYYYPSYATMTSEETNEYSSLYTDIETYVTASIANFISGEMDIETEWDSYVAEVESMQIDRCIELKQAAYDRYVSRGEE